MTIFQWLKAHFDISQQITKMLFPYDFCMF